MPTKRRVLETLSLKELQDIAGAYELDPVPSPPSVTLSCPSRFTGVAYQPVRW